MPRVFSGHVRLCLGYTEPEGGSDVATCKTRAVRDGDCWVINGSKMFTTGAHNCQYVFLITNTDPDAPKHKSLTMFLVPLDSPGIEIQGIRTVDGDRTNIVYYSDVRVDDKYRLGEVNDGLDRGARTAQRRARRGGSRAGRPAGRVDHDAPGRFHGRRRWTRPQRKVDRARSRRPPADRRRVGRISAGPQRRPDGGGAVARRASSAGSRSPRRCATSRRT